MDYVTNETVTNVLGADWSITGDADLAVLLANAWLAQKRLPLYGLGLVPEQILAAGAYIAKDVISGNMYQGRKDGVVVSKSVKAGPVTSSKTYASGVDGQSISSGEQMALLLIAPYIMSVPFSVPLGRF